MIEASFAMQYPSKCLYDDSMDWKEFCTLLAGIMPETPLGQIITIRAEDREDMIASFSSEQKKMRNNWLEKMNRRFEDSATDEDTQQKIQELQDIFAEAFG